MPDPTHDAQLYIVGELSGEETPRSVYIVAHGTDDSGIFLEQRIIVHCEWGLVLHWTKRSNAGLKDFTCFSLGILLAMICPSTLFFKSCQSKFQRPRNPLERSTVRRPSKPQSIKSRFGRSPLPSQTLCSATTILGSTRSLPDGLLSRKRFTSSKPGS